MKRIRRMSIFEGLFNLLFLLLFVLAEVVSYFMVKSMAEGVDAFVIIFYILYLGIGMAPSVLLLIISGIGLLCAKTRGFNAWSVVGIIGKALAIVALGACVSFVILEASSVSLTTLPFAVLFVLFVVSCIASIVACRMRKRLLRELSNVATAEEAEEIPYAEESDGEH